MVFNPKKKFPPADIGIIERLRRKRTGWPLYLEGIAEAESDLVFSFIPIIEFTIEDEIAWKCEGFEWTYDPITKVFGIASSVDSYLINPSDKGKVLKTTKQLEWGMGYRSPIKRYINLAGEIIGRERLSEKIPARYYQEKLSKLEGSFVAAVRGIKDQIGPASDFRARFNRQ